MRARASGPVGERVRVLLFATAREAVGRAALSRPMDAGGTSLEEFLRTLRTEFPRLGPVLRTSRIFRNGELVRSATGTVAPGDEIAIHPPYSGG